MARNSQHAFDATRGALIPGLIPRLISGVLMALAMSFTAAAEPLQESMTKPGGAPTLGVGDAVTLQVFGRPELNTTANIADDGTITVPLAGRIEVVGLSPASAAQEVAKALHAGQFLVNPQVTISLTQQFYVYGEVQAPNMYKLEPNMTVMQALARSGGITTRGSERRLEIKRRSSDGQFLTIKPELTDLIQANDVLRVKERIF